MEVLTSVGSVLDVIDVVLALVLNVFLIIFASVRPLPLVFSLNRLLLSAANSALLLPDPGRRIGCGRQRGHRLVCLRLSGAAVRWSSFEVLANRQIGSANTVDGATARSRSAALCRCRGALSGSAPVSHFFRLCLPGLTSRRCQSPSGSADARARKTKVHSLVLLQLES
jgi:hypothetical protein